MEPYKIDTTVPLPPAKTAAGKYPFADMKVGDSFLVPGQTGTSVVGNSAMVFGRRQNPPQKFTMRKVPEGVRCWRIA